MAITLRNEVRARPCFALFKELKFVAPITAVTADQESRACFALFVAADHGTRDQPVGDHERGMNHLK